MRHPATRPDRAPLRGPAAWFIRFAGLNGIICPLGFGAFTIPSILSVAGGSGSSTSGGLSTAITPGASRTAAPRSS